MADVFGSYNGEPGIYTDLNAEADEFGDYNFQSREILMVARMLEK